MEVTFHDNRRVTFLWSFREPHQWSIESIRDLWENRSPIHHLQVSGDKQLWSLDTFCCRSGSSRQHQCHRHFQHGKHAFAAHLRRILPDNSPQNIQNLISKFLLNSFFGVTFPLPTKNEVRELVYFVQLHSEWSGSKSTGEKLMEMFVSRVDQFWNNSHQNKCQGSQKEISSSNPLIFRCYCWWFRNPANLFIGSFSLYLQGYIHSRWCRISSINNMLISGRLIYILSACKNLENDKITGILLPKLFFGDPFGCEVMWPRYLTDRTWKVSHLNEFMIIAINFTGKNDSFEAPPFIQGLPCLDLLVWWMGKNEKNIPQMVISCLKEIYHGRIRNKSPRYKSSPFFLGEGEGMNFLFLVLTLGHSKCIKILKALQWLKAIWGAASSFHPSLTISLVMSEVYMEHHTWRAWGDRV